MATDVLHDAAPSRGNAAAADTDLGGIGALLRSARERRGQTIEQIAQLTKIPQRHLLALERGDLAAVPGSFYQRAEIRTFAKAVGLDPDAVIAQLDLALTPPPRRESGPKAAHLPAMPSGRALLMIAIGVVATLALVSRAIVLRAPAVTNARHIEDSALRNSEGAAVRNGVPVDSAPGQDRPGTGGNRLTATTGTLPLTSGPQKAAAPSPAVAAASTAPSAPAAAAALEVEPASARVAGTELIVTSQPPGARVTVNGIAWGVTPVTIRYLPSGDKEIRVSLPGYETADRLVHLGAARLAAGFALRTAP
jgi:cytoskeletal protein RodZ